MVSKMGIAMIVLGIVGAIAIAAGTAIIWASSSAQPAQEREVSATEGIPLEGVDEITIVADDPVIVKGAQGGGASAWLHGAQVAIPAIKPPAITQRPTANGVEIGVRKDWLVGVFRHRIGPQEERLVLEVTVPSGYRGRVVVQGGSDARVEGLSAQRVSVDAGGDVVLSGVSAQEVDAKSSWGGVRVTDVRSAKADVEAGEGDVTVERSSLGDAILQERDRGMRAHVTDSGAQLECGDQYGPDRPSISLAGAGLLGNATLEMDAGLQR